MERSAIRGGGPAFPPAFAGVHAGYEGLRLPRQTFGGKLVEVILPVGVVMTAEVEEIIPTVDAGRMQVVEHEAHGIIADRLHFEDRDISLAGNGLALVGRVTLHLGARALDPQVLGGKSEALAAVEGDGENPAVLVQPDFRRPGLRLLRSDCSRLRRRFPSQRAAFPVECPPAAVGYHVSEGRARPQET